MNTGYYWTYSTSIASEEYTLYPHRSIAGAVAHVEAMRRSWATIHAGMLVGSKVEPSAVKWVDRHIGPVAGVDMSTLKLSKPERRDAVRHKTRYGKLKHPDASMCR